MNSKCWPESELQWNDFIVTAELDPGAWWSISHYLSPFLGLPCLCFLLPQAKYLMSSLHILFQFSILFLHQKTRKQKTKTTPKQTTPPQSPPKIPAPQSSTLFCKYFTAKFIGPWDYSFFPFPHLQWGKMTDQVERTKLIGGLKVNGDNKELHSPEKRKQI